MDYEVKNFQQDVIEASHSIPVLVDFWAEWCGPCRKLGPVLEKLAKEFEGKIKLVKVDAEANPEEAMKFQIRGIPNVKLFVNGEVADEFSGAIPESKVREWIQKHLPESGELKLAKELLAQGKGTEALEIIEKFLVNEPQNSSALLMAAKIYLFSDPLRSAGLLGRFEPKSEDLELYDSLVLLAEMLSLADNHDKLPEGAVKGAFTEALQLLKKQEFAGALGLLIGIIRDDRYYFEDGSRKLCIAIFKYLGEEDPVTLEFRRDFGRALY